MLTDDVLLKLPDNHDVAFVELVNRLDHWLGNVNVSELDRAREHYAEVLLAFTLGKDLGQSLRDNARDQYGSVSSWWAKFTREVTFLKAICVFRESGGDTPLANPDMPSDIKKDYEEARSIVSRSPRGASALLRLAIQKICKELGEAGKNLNDDIGSLVQNGLPSRVQQALDAVRVIGNDAVHSGQVDLSDDIQTATTLFRLVNFITEKMISEPMEIERIYGSLPAEKLAAIQERDGKG
jgi:hypothetical protein